MDPSSPERPLKDPLGIEKVPLYISLWTQKAPHGVKWTHVETKEPKWTATDLADSIKCERMLKTK
jgi:hypothetical protein